MDVRNIPYSCQSIDEDDIREVISVLRSPLITQGPKIREFEERLSNYSGAKFSVAFSSGTAALHGAYFAAGLGEGDELITSPITFAATSNAALYLKGKPVFADVERETGNIDPAQIEQKITSSTKVIAPVDYAGNPVRLAEIRALARKHELIVVEDACHSLGAIYQGKKIGSCEHADLTILSFHPVKHITTGEGGAVLTNDENYYKKLMMFRTHGIAREQFVNQPHGDWYYEMQALGYNYRMTDFAAALGVSQLRKLDGFIAKRRAIVEQYRQAFAGNEYFDIPVETERSESSYHLYPIRLKGGLVAKKSLIFSLMRSKGMGVQVHYQPVYLQPYYQKLGYQAGSCPIAEDFYQREISIPLYQSMKDSDVEYVIGKVFETFKELK